MSLRFIANEPWAISESGLQLVVAVASKDEFFAEVRDKALKSLDGAPFGNSRGVTVQGGVATIPVDGPTFRKANLMTDMSGGVSYETLRRDIEAQLVDPSVSSILLVMDSPGGEAKGVSELAAFISEAKTKKPIKAYVAGTAASAAYWLASAASEVIASDMAILGSIGAVAVFQGKDNPDEIEIVSSQSPMKNAKPTTKAGKASIQARIDALADVFIGAVAKNRGVSTDTVLEKFGKGDVFVGAGAVAAGLADRVSTLDAVLAEMADPLVKLGQSLAGSKSPVSGISLMDFGRMEVA